jgi:hypothetical protein
MTKAYQVFKGEEDKHGHQQYDLQATYFDRDRALDHCKQIVEADEFKNEKIEEAEYGNGKYKSWTAIGWTFVTICRLEEIEIF